MNMVTHLLSSSRGALTFLCLVISFTVSDNSIAAGENVQPVASPTTRTVVAEVLEVEGDFHIVRGERGEIRIEVTSDTQVSEEFIYGDRIKAVLLPNDVALMITRAAPDEPIGIKTNEPSEPPPLPTSSEKDQSSEGDSETTSPLYSAYQVPNVRVIIADILMVDGSFIIIRSDYGEIQIEVTEETELSEEFKFGDRIKARVTPADKALTVIRARKDEPTGVFEEDDIERKPSTTPAQPTHTTTPTPAETNSSDPLASEIPTTRIIVADVLMVDGDVYIVRGERGEIRIEITPKTSISESFDYGDRIKAEVLPNDKALTIERADPNDPIGITTP